MRKSGYVVLVGLSLVFITVIFAGKAIHRSSFPELPRTILVSYGHDVRETLWNQRYDIYPDYFDCLAPTPDPWSGNTKITIDLVNFGRDMYCTDSILVELDKLGMRPATMNEFISLDTLYLKFQQEYLGRIPPNRQRGVLWVKGNDENYIVILGTEWWAHSWVAFKGCSVTKVLPYYAYYFQQGGNRWIDFFPSGSLLSQDCYFAAVKKW